MKYRNFTRTDVANFVQRCFERIPEPSQHITRKVVEIRTVSLLTGTHTPIWHVAFTVIPVIQGSSVSLSDHYDECCLVTQNLKYAPRQPREYYLTFLTSIELPEGCATIQEEDRAAKRDA